MVGAGFEPAKAEPTGLQPVPFDRSGTPPGVRASLAPPRGGTVPRSAVESVIAAYLSELTARLEARLGERLVAAWVVGSGALGDFDPETSDVDVQAVATEQLPHA